MKKGLQRGLSMLVAMMMLTGLVPVGVMAEATSGENEALVNQESVSMDSTITQSNSTENVNITGDEPVTATEEKETDPAEQIVPQDSLTTDAIETSASIAEGFNYVDIDGGIRITGYTLFGGDVVIPVTLDSKKVLEIGDSAFYYKSNITSVTLPEGVTSIGNSAFSSCSSLVSISIPGSATSIGNSAFSSCSSLVSISIPGSITSIGSCAFYYCGSLKSISMPQSVTSIGNSAFSGCESLKSIGIPESVTSIGDSAFNNCSSLETINIPKAVTTLSINAFNYCPQLKSIIVSADNLKYASIDGVLYNKAGSILILCPEGLINLSIPEGVMKIEVGAISGCTNLLSVSIPKSMPKISDSAFYGCTGLTSLSIAEGVTIIGTCSFYNCTSLASVSLPKGITSIGANAFSDCTGLSSIVIPEGVTSIGDGVFNNCTSLSSLSIPQSVTRISNSALYNCISLTSINLQEGVTSIGDTAFYNCTSLMSINLPASVTSIGDSAFQSCTSLMNITIPEGVVRIGTNAFNQCTSLTHIGFPESLTSIGDHSFDDCTYLASITVEADNSSFESISGVLYNKEGTNLIRCPEGLTSVSIPQGVISIDDYAFYNCTYLTAINIPQGVANIGNYAFYNCNILNKVVIPDSVTAIYNGAFYNCPLLSFYGVTGSYAEGYAKLQNIPFVISAVLSVKSFTLDQASGQTVNTEIKLTAAGKSGTLPYQYKFYYKLGSDTVTIQDFSTADTVTFKPITAGTYTLYVDVKDGSGKTATKSIDNYIIVNSLSVKTFTTDKASGQTVNTDIKLTAAGDAGMLPYQYKFYYKLGADTVTINDFSTTDTVTFKPTTAGTYTLCVDVKDVNGKTATKNISNYVITAQTGPVAPINLKTMERTNNSVTIAWDAAQGASSYNIYKNGVKVNAEPVTETQFIAEGLTSKTEYTFTVKSLMNEVESATSSEMKVKTMGDPVSLTVGTVTGAPGENVVLKIDISDNSTISAGLLNVGFDNEKLEYVGTKPGTMAQEGTIVTNQVGNQVTIGYINQTMLTQAGTFLELEFKIKEGIADQNLPITLTSLELTDLVGFDLIPVTTNGEIKVSGIILGDINGDGSISAFDALMALQIATGKIMPSASQKFAGDIDGNGSVSAFEGLRILQFATGKTTTL